MKQKQNIYSLYAINCLQGMVFYAPVATLYRQARGISLAQIGVIESVSLIFSLLLELPWGLLADRIGYRKTMVSCCGLFFLSKLIFWQASGFGMFLLERVVLSVVLAGLSGVDASMLYLSCEADESHRVFGYYDAFGTAGLLFSAWFYAVFIGENYQLAALATVVSYGLAALLSLRLREVRVDAAVGCKPAGEFVALLRQTIRDHRFLLFLLGAAVYGETVQIITVWLNQSQYIQCGMSESMIGWVYIAATVVSLLSAFSAKAVGKTGFRRFAVAAFFVTGVAGVLLAFTRSSIISVCSILAITAVSALLMPLFSELYNRRVSSQNRATQLSIFAALGNTISAGTNIIYGKVADTSLQAAFLIGVGACVIGCAAFLYCYRAADDKRRDGQTEINV